jgi:hypothetical protein
VFDVQAAALGKSTAESTPIVEQQTFLNEFDRDGVDTTGRSATRLRLLPDGALLPREVKS